MTLETCWWPGMVVPISSTSYRPTLVWYLPAGTMTKTSSYMLFIQTHLSSPTIKRFFFSSYHSHLIKYPQSPDGGFDCLHVEQWCQINRACYSSMKPTGWLHNKHNIEQEGKLCLCQKELMNVIFGLQPPHLMYHYSVSIILLLLSADSTFY